MVSIIIILKFILFIHFWLRWVFIAACGLSLVTVSRGYSLLWCADFSLRWRLLLQSTGSRCAGFSSCGEQAQQLWLVGSKAQAQQLWRVGLVAPRHVGSSRTRVRTRVSCTFLTTVPPGKPMLIIIINYTFFSIQDFTLKADETVLSASSNQNPLCSVWSEGKGGTKTE